MLANSTFLPNSSATCPFIVLFAATHAKDINWETIRININLLIFIALL